MPGWVNAILMIMGIATGVSIGFCIAMNVVAVKVFLEESTEEEDRAVTAACRSFDAGKDVTHGQDDIH